MKIIIIGYPDSQKIVPITKVLLKKYMPEFEHIFINYKGKTENWSRQVRRYLSKVEDEIIVFTLDDYLINKPVDMDRFNQAVKEIKGNVVCVRLCASGQSGIQDHYPVVAQYCIWRREDLMRVLKETTNPWDFELSGSKALLGWGKSTFGYRTPIVSYSDCSALSMRNKSKINVSGLEGEDLDLVLQHYKKEDFVYGW